MMRQDFRVVIGDANGADRALQDYLDRSRYKNVVVFCSGKTCRNNVGSWEVRTISVDPKLTGRAFYIEKDKALALEADLGFVLWDGKSAGAIGNVLELLKQGKPVVVYLAPERRFFTLKHPEDMRPLLSHCTQDNYRSIDAKIQLDRHLQEFEASPQGSFAL